MTIMTKTNDYGDYNNNKQINKNTWNKKMDNNDSHNNWIKMKKLRIIFKIRARITVRIENK